MLKTSHQRRIWCLVVRVMGTLLLVSPMRISSAAPVPVPQPAMALQLGHPEAIQALAFSPDGGTLASLAAGGIKFWDLPTGELRRSIALSKAPDTSSGGEFLFLPRSWEKAQRLLYSAVRGVNWEYDGQSGKLLRQWTGAEYSSNSIRIMARNRNGRIVIWDAETGRRLGAIRSNPIAPDWELVDKPETLYFPPDGRRVASVEPGNGVSDGEVRVWNLCTGKKIFVLSDLRGGFGANVGATNPVAWSSDGNLLATGGEDPYWQHDDTGPGSESTYMHKMALKVWNAHTGKLLHTWHDHFDFLGGGTDGMMTFLPHSFRVTTDEGVFDVRTGKRIREWRKSDWWILLSNPQALGPLNRGTLSPDRSRLATIGSDNFTIDVLNLRTGRHQYLPRRPVASGFP